jgi:phenylacetic acid degradation operon negative regulatory protein
MAGSAGAPAATPAAAPEGASAGAPAAKHEAFADYVRAVTDWRRLPYCDPGLPAELLPSGWIGIRAAEDFFALRALLEGPAQVYVQQVLSG